jgi:hypothetical protein
MLTFRHLPSRRIIGVNYKVLLSFVSLRPEFERVDLRWCDYLLWRDPLERTVSLFFDKCRQAVNPDKVQEIQQTLMDALGLTDVVELKTLSFERFVGGLEPILKRDRHVWPQLYRVTLADVGEVVDIAIGLPRLGRRLGIDFTVRENVTSHGPALEYYTAETRAIIERLYRDDYRARGHRSLRFKAKRLLGLIN